MSRKDSAESLVRRLDGRALFFDGAPLEAARSNLQKSADLFREAAREIERLRGLEKFVRHVRVVRRSQAGPVQLWFGETHIANVEPDCIAAIALTRFASGAA